MTNPRTPEHTQKSRRRYQNNLPPHRSRSCSSSVAKRDSTSRPREWRGDFMSAETRSRVMARIRGKDTGPERVVFDALKSMNLDFEQHVRELPGRPDFVIRQRRLAIFVDGDFWHGWRFGSWRHKLSEHWESKIEANIRRDTRNRRKLRAMGWTVLRIWEHQLENVPAAGVDKLRKLIDLN